MFEDENSKINLNIYFYQKEQKKKPDTMLGAGENKLTNTKSLFSRTSTLVEKAYARIHTHTHKLLFAYV